MVRADELKPGAGLEPATPSSEPGTVVGAVAQAAQTTGATHALVVQGNTPVAFVETGGLSIRDSSPIRDLTERWALDEVTVSFERPGEPTFEGPRGQGVADY